MIELTQRGDLTVVALRHGKANALDLELLRAISATLQNLESSGRVLVLTGNGTMFSAGVDLVRLVDSGPAYISAFLPELDTALGRLLRYPRPVVAAIDGHAIAGGCLLAACCDHRVMLAGKGRIGVPELPVGVPFPHLPLEILRSLLPGHRFQEVVYLGKTVLADEARAIGFVDEVVSVNVVDRACEVANRLAAVHPDTFAMTKHRVRRPLLAALEETREFDLETSAAWQSEAVLNAVRGYVAATLKK